MKQNNWILVPLLAVIVLACLASGIILEIYGLDSSKAWEGFAAALGALVGVHVPAPKS
jgi:hypothetical protein